MMPPYDDLTTPTEIRPDSYWQGELNESQWEAVRTLDCPLLVIAGAGSGKTRVLTYKIAYMLEHGFAPHSILALTFTNKAAREMNDRIAKIVGLGRSRGLWSGTFHSIFNRILRAESQAIGFKSDFTIYDSTDSRSLLKSIVKEMGLDDKKYKASAVAHRISEAKNHLILPSEYAADAQTLARDQRENLPDTHRIYKEYFLRCRRANAMDFDDLLLYTYLLFFHNEEIRQKYVRRFAYLLVDEYQDTNFAQHTIINQLTRDRQQLCVVGDDAQSIYSFRGADIDNILQFHRQYEGAKVVKLEQNYRSTQNIVEAANSIILRNKGQIAKNVYSLNERGEQLLLLPAASDKEEAAKVTGLIARLHRTDEVPYEEIAILYRTNAQSRSFEDALRAHNLPYRIYGGLSFYQRKEIKDLIAYFRLLNNLEDEEAFKRIVNYPARGIGNTTLQKIFTASREHSVSLWAVAEQPDRYGLKFNKGTLGKLEGFVGLMMEFRSKSLQLTAYDLALDILTTTGIKAELSREDGPEGQSKRENVEELLGSIRAFEQENLEATGSRFTPLADYLSQVSLLTDTDQNDDGAPKITLMTIHAAKGLEFEAVFVTGLEDGLFPSTQARLYPREMEEERRLFYVAVTRAKRYCYLSYAQSRYRYGQLDFAEASPFVREIDSQYLREESGHASRLDAQIAPSLRRALFEDTIRHTPSRSEESSSVPSRNHRAERAPSAADRLATRSFHPSQFARPQTAARPSLSVRSDRPSTPKVAHSAADPLVGKSLGRAGDVRVGMRICHERFGFGTVLAVEGAGDNAKARVEFDHVGSKNLLLKFAKFTLES